MCYIHKIKFLFTNISLAGNDEALRGVLQKETVLTCMSDVGFTKPLSTVRLAHKDEIISTIVTFHLFIKVKAVMDQFKEGLGVAGLLQHIKKYYDLMTPLFVNERSSLTGSKRYMVLWNVTSPIVYATQGYYTFRSNKGHVYCSLF